MLQRWSSGSRERRPALIPHAVNPPQAGLEICAAVASPPSRRVTARVSGRVVRGIVVGAVGIIMAPSPSHARGEGLGQLVGFVVCEGRIQLLLVGGTVSVKGIPIVGGELIEGEQHIVDERVQSSFLRVQGEVVGIPMNVTPSPVTARVFRREAGREIVEICLARLSARLPRRPACVCRHSLRRTSVFHLGGNWRRRAVPSLPFVARIDLQGNAEALRQRSTPSFEGRRVRVVLIHRAFDGSMADPEETVGM